MFSFFRPKSELCALFEIGSSSVGAALARMTPGKGTEILYTFREGMPRRERVEPKRLMADMRDALSRASARLAKEAVARERASAGKDFLVKHVAYSLSSPWAVARSKTVSIGRKEPFALTPEMVDAAVDLEVRAIEKELGGALSVIERRVVDVSLDGKPAADPYGKKASNVDVSFFASLAPKAVLDAVAEVSMSAHHPKDLRAFSFPLVAFSTVRDALHDKDAFAALDVGGEVSDLVAAKSGHLLEAASFPFGRHHLVRKVAQALGASFAEAESLVRLRFDGHGHGEDPALEAALRDASSEYAKALRAAIDRVSSEGSAPTDVALLAEGDVSKFFRDAVREAGLSATLFRADELRPAVTFAPRAEKDVSLAMVAAFAARTTGFDGARS